MGEKRGVGEKETGRLEIGDWRLGATRAPISNLQSPISNLLIAISFLLAALLRFYQLDGTSLWNDEGNSWAMLARAYGEIAAAAAADIHPPGYYWLLKTWSLLFGDSAWAMRSLSATLGVLLVVLVLAISRQVARNRPGWGYFPVLAALLAALNPFQIYYSQEARMYMLLAVEAAGVFWALMWIMEIGDWRLEIEGIVDSPIPAISNLQSPNHLIPYSLFILFGAAGLWTHYSFPIVLVAAGLAYGVWWLGGVLRPAHPLAAERRPWQSLLTFAAANLLLLLLFVPWLPTAIDRVLNWPKGGETISLVEGVALTLRTLLFGPLRDVPAPLWPWLAVAGLLPLLGLMALRRNRAALAALGFWLLLPIAMMAALGLFTDAFLKFLLIASPAWCLLAAAAPWIIGTDSGQRRATTVLAVAVAAFGVASALAVLPSYYQDGSARDNYRGVAQYVAAVGDPAGDLVVLDAPGQQEVWRYYDPGVPALALPDQRPPDRAATEAALVAAAAGKRMIYALFWATDEADPEQVVEQWLDRNAFKAFESWQGNLRFAAYAVGDDLTAQPLTPIVWDNGMVLDSVSLPAGASVLHGGDVALAQLGWSAPQPLDRRYKISVQLLDGRGQVVAQHDSEPAGGSRPTDTWQADEPIVDNHAVPIAFGTPPGDYQLALVVYDAETGERVRQPGGDVLPLGAVSVARADVPAPVAVIPMQHRVDAALGPVILAGYDLYKQGYAHAPETPLAPGDLLHVTLYWLAPDPLPAEWPADQSFTLRLGDQRLTAPLAGGAYPTGEWAPGELVRGDFDVLYGGSDRRPVLAVSEDEMPLDVIPVR